jgi:phosphoribosylanthranilate isomerase
MIHGIRLKICGLTSLVDAALADQSGADYLGFVLYAESPRRVTLAQFGAMVARLPARRKVAVMVEPAPADLTAAVQAGFDFCQVLFRMEKATAVAGWVEAVGAERLWLAPKLPAAADLPVTLLPLVGTFLLDAFAADRFGGTGRNADWPKFRRHREAHPEKTWILAGGLNPENIGEALAATGARCIDVNSGVEVSPGVKDAAKLQSLVERLRAAKQSDCSGSMQWETTNGH